MTARGSCSTRLPGSPLDVLRRCADPQVAAARATADPAMPGSVTELAGTLVRARAAEADGRRDGSRHGPRDGIGETAAGDEPALVFAVSAAIPTSWLPPAVVGRGITPPSVCRRETWRLVEGEAGAPASARASVEVTLPGVPATSVEMSSRLVAVPSASAEDTGNSGSDLVIDVAVTVGIPFIGAAIERSVLASLEGAITKEAHVIAKG